MGYGRIYGKYDYWKKGSWNVFCQRCQSKCKREQLKQEWTGLWVCDKSVHNCWEERHPQDFVIGLPDDQSVYPALDMSLQFLKYTDCVADIGCADECSADIWNLSFNGYFTKGATF